MSRLPRVAIVGRPNVGKSTLLNRLVNSRVSIVEPTAGVTRDRVSLPVRIPTDFGERTVEIMDTGGIGIVDRQDLGPLVEEQVETAVGNADLIVFMVDVRDGITPLDKEVAERLRRVECPVVLVCNKAEGDRMAWEVDQFRALGLSAEPIPISAQNGEGLEDFFSAISDRLPVPREDEMAAVSVMKLAIVGRRNAGKSTLTNALAREERMIVSEVAGTTRDAVDVLFERDGRSFTVIDTAGVRKKSSFEDAIDFFSDSRAYRAVRRADVVVLLFDAMEPLSGLEKRLARYAMDHYKPVVLGANKWDTVGDQMTAQELSDYIEAELPGLRFAPLVCLSGKDQWRVDELLETAEQLYQQAHTRVGTGELNRVVQRAVAGRGPSSSGHRVRIHYATQAERLPPTIVVFVNDKRLIGKDYIRYLTNRFREETPFKEVPIRVVLRDSEDTGEDED
ncbi:GTPase Der [Planctomycetes bacterium Pla163]|uniref:GTPase Der n=1 Tax=Rohdeia mirabilis TaxID=2528008 RepID=A0A518CYJ9_9BACT|nr:GTPase Der [Planctomycetes bacterium Pla163]